MMQYLIYAEISLILHIMRMVTKEIITALLYTYINITFKSNILQVKSLLTSLLISI